MRIIDKIHNLNAFHMQKSEQYGYIFLFYEVRKSLCPNNGDEKIHLSEMLFLAYKLREMQQKMIYI